LSKESMTPASMPLLLLLARRLRQRACILTTLRNTSGGQEAAASKVWCDVIVEIERDVKAVVKAGEQDGS
jgi:hypothetical protein